MKYNEMSTVDVVEYINGQLQTGRTMKDIEEKDFGENKGVIQKRLNRKGYIKTNNQFVPAKDNNTINTTRKLHLKNNNTTKENTKIIQDEKQKTTNEATEIIQTKHSEKAGNKAFSNDEINKLNRLLELDLDTLDKMINEYATKNNTSCSFKIENNKTTVTSIRVNEELYKKVKQKAKENGEKLQDVFFNMMLNYLK